MSDRIRASKGGFIAALAVVIAVALVVPADIAAQANQASTWTKKTPDGQPDLQGYWAIWSTVPLERPANCGTKEFYTEEEMKLPANQRCPAATTNAAPGGQRGGGAAAAGGGQRGGGGRGAAGGGGGRGAAAAAPQQASSADVHYDLAQFGLNLRTQAEDNRTSQIVGPEGRIPPLSEIGLARQQELQARQAEIRPKAFDAPEYRSNTERCLVWSAQGPPMTSPGYNSHVQILQSEGHVMILPEMMQDARIIPLDKDRPHAPEAVKTWGGDSRGYWEGDTLVVETTNFNGRNPLRNVSGTTMVLTERFRRIDENTLQYEYTVNDPAWTKPWTAQVKWAKAEGPLWEYACHEGNYGMYNILSGARAAEKAAAGAQN